MTLRSKSPTEAWCIQKRLAAEGRKNRQIKCRLATDEARFLAIWRYRLFVWIVLSSKDPILVRHGGFQLYGREPLECVRIMFDKFDQQRRLRIRFGAPLFPIFQRADVSSEIDGEEGARDL